MFVYKASMLLSVLLILLPFCSAGLMDYPEDDYAPPEGGYPPPSTPGYYKPPSPVPVVDYVEPPPTYNVTRTRQIVRNRYIMKLKEGYTENEAEDALRYFQDSYYHEVEDLRLTSGLVVIKGLLSRRALRRLKAKPGIEYLVNDEMCHISCLDRALPTDAWALDSLDASADNRLKFNVQPTAGSTVVYVLDTGIRVSHDEFQTETGSRASELFTAVKEAYMHPHGTACAAIVGGKNYGVNPDVVLKDVHVMNNFGLGFASDIITGIDRVIVDHKQRGPGAKSIISMSLGQEFYEPLDTAVRNAVKEGIIVVTASGNNGINATQISPCHVEDSICVGAVDVNNEWMSWSNYGPSVDVSGPGADVKSAGTDADDTYYQFYGTSFACPHVSGVLSAYISSSSESVTQRAAMDYIRNNAAPIAQFSRANWAPTAGTPSLCLNVAKCPINEEVVDCGEPNQNEGVIQRGDTTTTLGSARTYSCEAGLIFGGSERRVCQEDGSWSGEETTCTPVRCQEPSETDALMRGEGFGVGSSRTFSCPEGHRLQGPSVIFCQASGNWNATSPTCTVSCADPVLDGVVLMSGVGTGVGARKYFWCPEGMRLDGAYEIFCRPDGTWNASVPTCFKVECAEPELDANVQVIGLGNEVGSERMYACNPPLTLEGPGRRTCLLDGSWSGIAPTCVGPRPQEIVGPLSELRNDAHSEVRCPANTVAVKCECEPWGSCDGAYIVDGVVCRAFCSGFVAAVRPKVTCEPRNTMAPVATHRAPVSAYSRKPVARCPPGTQLVGCSIHSPWLPYYPGITSRIENGNTCTTSINCGRNDRQGCGAYATCRGVAMSPMARRGSD